MVFYRLKLMYTTLGRKVSVSVVEAFEKNVKPKELEETLRMEYRFLMYYICILYLYYFILITNRSKLLNPKWSELMIKQGSAGAYEISGRFTAMMYIILYECILYFFCLILLNIHMIYKLSCI